MCGIAGFNFENRELLKKMCNLIKHRGPDDDGYFSDSKVSIGMRRLSIIDLNTGHQPQHNENNDIWVIHNGEIYNFIEIKILLESRGHQFYTQSDTEVIVHSYEEWGENCVKKFRGVFAFCIYDSKKEILFLARDHMGLKPIYYFFDGERFIFGSEIKCILRHDIIREVDKDALSLYLSLRYVPFNQTLFKDVYKVPPSSFLSFDLKSKQIDIKKYWDIKYNIVKNKQAYTLAKELRGLLEESIKIRLVSDVPLGSFLSGGIDSSAIVAIMSKYMDEPVKTFSIGFKEGATIDETKYSRYVAEYFNTDHKEIIINPTTLNKELSQIIWHSDDLINDFAMMWINIMARYARKDITVALTGDGADEVFAGYFSGYLTERFSFVRVIPESVIDFFMKFNKFIPSYKARFALSYLNLSKNEENVYIRGILQIPDEEKREIFQFKVEKVQTLIRNVFIKGLDNINQFINWDLVYQLPNLYNMKLDRSTMAASLEARVPYLDRKIITWASSVPSNLKLKGNTEKYILRLALKDLLPKTILNRKKYGFGTPASFWLKTQLNELVESVLERLEKRNYLIKPSYVKKINRNRSKSIYVNRVLNLFMFELWYETFFENSGFNPIVF